MIVSLASAKVMARVAAASAAVLLGAVVWTPPAVAATESPRFRTLAHAAFHSFNDNSRYVVYTGTGTGTGSATLSVYDVRTGRVHHVRSGCRRLYPRVNDTEVAVAADGHALVTCRGNEWSSSPQRLVDLARGTSTPIAGHWRFMGRQWLFRSGTNVCAYNWHTHRVRRAGCRGVTYRNVDLDQRDMRVRCSRPADQFGLVTGHEGRWRLQADFVPYRLYAIGCRPAEKLRLTGAVQGTAALRGDVVTHARRLNTRDGYAWLGAVDLATHRRYRWSLRIATDPDAWEEPDRPMMDSLPGAVIVTQPTRYDDSLSISIATAWSVKVALLPGR
jgi:hypothetical protein